MNFYELIFNAPHQNKATSSAPGIALNVNKESKTILVTIASFEDRHYSTDYQLTIIDEGFQQDYVDLEFKRAKLPIVTMETVGGGLKVIFTLDAHSIGCQIFCTANLVIPNRDGSFSSGNPPIKERISSSFIFI